jgi:hypothetical protein
MGLWYAMGGSTEIQIEEAYAIHNMLLLHGFAIKHTSITSQVKRDSKTFQKDNWKEKLDPDGLRAWTRERYDQWVEKFSWNQDLLVKIIPAIHGTNETEAYNIIQSNFVALSKLDSGYYGKGIYFTSSVEYALPYFATKPNPTVIICLVISGNAYPVIEHPTKSGKGLSGAALMPGYNSHYVLTRKNGFPCSKITSGKPGEEFYDEIVIEQEASILPFYLLKISRNNLGPIALKLQKEIDRLNREEGTELGRSGSTNPQPIASGSRKIIKDSDTTSSILQRSRPNQSSVQVVDNDSDPEYTLL